jgi:hydrogenase maturation protease
MVKSVVKAPILVLGIGNILLHDEGLGVFAVEAMERLEPLDNVELLDGGTAGADLLDAIADRRKVIVIDALDADVEPGTILRLKPEDLLTDTSGHISLHEFSIAETLRMTRYLHCEPKEVVIVGVKPMDLNPGIGLSNEMTARLPKIIECVLAEIKTADKS